MKIGIPPTFANSRIKQEAPKVKKNDKNCLALLSFIKNCVCVLTAFFLGIIVISRSAKTQPNKYETTADKTRRIKVLLGLSKIETKGIRDTTKGIKKNIIISDFGLIKLIIVT